MSIPDQALDGRLAIVGITGSGKSTTAKGGVERLLASGRRVCVVDLLDAWWGLRLARDGKTPAYPVAIFGGRHGDLPLTDHAGAVIGQAVAQSDGSSIVSLSELDGDATRRRFALAFFDALHKVNRAPLHPVIDETDFYSPQNPVSDGPGPLLLNRIKEIAARGRMRGFRCWSITQRPAKLHKDVLSQADTLIAMQLTSTQDRKAIEGWIGDQGDRDVGRSILAALPALKLGQGVVWSPRIGVLETATFPLPATYDSSRTPAYGEKVADVELKPINLGALRERMAKVEADTKANDPKALRAEIARLTAEVAKRPAAINPETLRAEYERGHADGALAAAKEWGRRETDAMGKLHQVARLTSEALSVFTAEMPTPDRPPAKGTGVVHRQAEYVPAPANPVKFRQNSPAIADGISRPQQRILDALAWLEVIGIPSADRTRVAMLADQSPKSSGFEKNVSTLSTKGLIMYPRPGDVRLTEDGRSAANKPATPPTNADLHNAIRGKISGPQWTLLEVLIGTHPAALSRAELAERARVSAASSGFEKNVSTLSGFGFVTYPERGQVAAAEILFVE